jgi:hypothetical protein
MHGNTKRKRTPAEHEALKKYGGMTRAQYNQSQRRPATRTGSYTVRALFAGNPLPQEGSFPSEAAALSRFIRLSSNPDLLFVTILVERTNSNGFKRQEAIYSYTRTKQEFANGGKAWWDQRERKA